MFTSAIFTELFWCTIQAWGNHGYLPKSKTSTEQNQTQLQGDNIQNFHAQLSQVLHSFRTSESCLRRVTLPMGPTGVTFVDSVPCILYVIQDMQESNMLCGRYGPHTPQIQRQLCLCNVDYKRLACHNRNVNICMQILCILLRNPMTLQFDNVGHSMDWTMHFSTWKWLILTVAYLVVHQWRHFTHSARVWLKWSLML
jgi:hypothetical protein